jgi:transcription elongation factor S-II
MNLTLSPKECPSQLDLPITPYRQKVLSKFESLFGDQDELSKKCEQALANYILELSPDPDDSKYKQVYLSKAINLCRNLDPNGSLENDYLHPRVMAGEIAPEELVRMSDQEMYPPKWKAISDQQLKDISRLDEENNNVVSDGLYTCGKCKENKCSYYQLQTRSCDEPTTTYVTCINCGNKWKE